MKLTPLLPALALLAALLPAAPATAQGCGPSNPNCIVPTAPLGTSTNQAASTKFVQQNGGYTGLHGDCTATSLGVITCTKTNGAPFGTMATQNASGIAVTGGTIAGVTISGSSISSPTISSPTISSPTINTAFTATGLVKYSDLAVAALATASNYYAAAASTVVPASVIYPSEVTITYGATTTVDFDTLINGVVTLTANITTLALTNVRAGKAGQIRFVQSGAGSFTWPAGGNAIFKYAGGALPALTTGSATAVDVLTYSCSTATFCLASLAKDVRNP